MRASLDPPKDIRSALRTAKGIAHGIGGDSPGYDRGGAPSAGMMQYNPEQTRALAQAIKRFSQARKAEFTRPNAQGPPVAPGQMSHAQLEAAPPVPPERPQEPALQQGAQDAGDLGQTIQTGADMLGLTPKPALPSAKGLMDPSSGAQGRIDLRGGTSAPSGEMAAYIRKRAPLYGIDPDVAVAVAQSEGLSSYIGDGGSSFGPFQLHIGGINPSMRQPGLGNVFIKQKGLDPRDQSTWPQQVDFALAYAGQNGWGAWNGAKDSAGRFLGMKTQGISPFYGIDRIDASRYPAPAQPSSDVAGPPQYVAPKSAAPQGGLSIPNVYRNGQSSQYPAPAERTAPQVQGSIDEPSANQTASLGPSDNQPPPQKQDTAPATQPPPDQDSKPDPMNNLYDKVAFMPSVQSGYNNFDVALAPDDSSVIPSARGGSILAKALAAARKHRDAGGPTYANSLDAVLGTNSPTMQDIFGFNYPNIPPPQPNIYVAPQATLGPSGSYSAPSTGSSDPATDTISQGSFLGENGLAPTGAPPILNSPAPISSGAPVSTSGGAGSGSGNYQIPGIQGALSADQLGGMPLPTVSGQYNPLNPNQGIDQIMQSPLGLEALFGVIPTNVEGGGGQQQQERAAPAVLPPLIPNGQVGNYGPGNMAALGPNSIPMASPGFNNPWANNIGTPLASARGGRIMDAALRLARMAASRR